MLIVFQNSFIDRLSSKRILNIIKDFTTPLTRRYTTLWKVDVMETTDDMKQMSCLTINFNLIYYSNVLRDLCHSEYSKCPFVARI